MWLTFDCYQDKDKDKKREKKKKDDEAEGEAEEEESRSLSRTGRALTAEEAHRKGRSILEEYFHLSDIPEAVACIRELNASEGLEMVRTPFHHVN